MMEESHTNRQEGLETFHAEIDLLKKLEENEKTKYFEGCNTTELGEEDKNIYEELKSNILTTEKFNTYRSGLTKHGNKSQGKFCAYVGNTFAKKINAGEIKRS